MSPLEILLRNKIRKEGPLKLSTFMHLCLLHPTYGYYKKSLPLGKDGDFITSPEISQLFGEMIALFFIDLWEKWERPSSFNFIEFGPGNGTLLSDIVRTFKKFSPVYEACHFFVLETNIALRQKQHHTFSTLSFPYQSFEDLSALLGSLPSSPTFFLGNEFLDVFPIDQYIFKDGLWHEKCIDFDEYSEKFFFKDILCPETSFQEVSFPILSASPPIFERSPLQENFLRILLEFLQNKCFSGVFIDYGYEQGTGDSFQSLFRHKFSNPLENLGDQDLTAHVNFKHLINFMKTQNPGLKTKGPFSQRNFLKRLGIDTRAQILIQSHPHAQKIILEGLHRLTDPLQMGTLFKVIEVHHHF